MTMPKPPKDHERDLSAREQKLANRETFLLAREHATGEHEAVVAEREETLQLREGLLRARSEVEQARLDREQLIAQMRSANEQLVLASIRADELAELATASTRAKDEFLAMLGHELRNPLAPIVTALEVMELRDPAVFPRERALISRHVEHMVRLVDDLLDSARITRGQVELRREPIELAQIVARAIEMVNPLLESKAHALTLAVPAHGLAIFGDPIRLAQVAANLLTNAANYTAAGGQIAVTGQREGAWVVLRIRDSGIGIAADMLPRIFDLFAQERQALARSRGGLGLGLAIVRSLVTLHGGSVAAYSEGHGHGSELVVKLPVVELTEHPALRTTSRAPVTANRRRILIVDDNVDIADLLAQVLVHLGHDVQVAYDGPSALAAIAAFAPEIALLDIGLPGMDGYELARTLRRAPSAQPLKLIAITGYGLAADRERTRAAGFDVHLVKPVDVATLRGAID